MSDKELKEEIRAIDKRTSTKEEFDEAILVLIRSGENAARVSTLNAFWGSVAAELHEPDYEIVQSYFNEYLIELQATAGSQLGEKEGAK